MTRLTGGPRRGILFPMRFPALLALAALPLLALPAPAGGDGEGEKKGGGRGVAKVDPEDPTGVARKILDAFDALDTDGDGFLSGPELPSAEAFKAIDADRDGKISPEELDRVLDAAPDPEEPPRPPKGPPPMPGPGDLPGDTFAERAKRILASDPRFHAETRRDGFLAAFDRDPQDGKVEKKEYAGGEVDRIFRDWDRDRNGSLDAREILGLAKEQIAELEKSRRRPTYQNFLLLFDLDNDRQVTREEYAFLRGPASAFAARDADRDGVVTYEESIYQGSRRANYKVKAGEGEAPPPKRTAWDLYDKDKDGRVTPGEFAGGEAVFRRLDRNRDGVLTAADV
jgi:Ca2+-binding EF-hand superfamily protein